MTSNSVTLLDRRDMTPHLARYDISRTYAWNYEHASAPVDLEIPEISGDWRFCGLKVDSPLGIPAGPLLNGRWCLYYASLGFDVLTYKTVRSRERNCYAMPNLQPVDCPMLRGGELDLRVSDKMLGSWAVSFGMPSKHPDVWRADVEWTRSQLPAGKLLSVSVVGSVEDGWTIADLADDYAKCAHWATESGADVVETNFSCPNVATCDGQLYQQPRDAAVVAGRVREAIGKTPFIAKIGHVTVRDEAAALLNAIAPFVDALAMTNSIAATVRDTSGQMLFNGQPRGICGEACRDGSIQQARLFAELIAERGDNVQLIGVGGASRADHVREYLDAGAHAVHMATSAMINPFVAVEIRAGLAGRD